MASTTATTPQPAAAEQAAATPAAAAATPAAAGGAPAAAGAAGAAAAAAGGAAGQPRPMSASLYVGDLDPSVGESLLFDMFKQVGPVASIRVCRDTVTRGSLGYAYVNYHNITDAERALDTLNYCQIKNRACRIMWSRRDPSIRKSGLGNVFIKNLDKSIDHMALYDTFSTFGNILSCKVVTNEAGESKGYGFVHYETAEAAQQAIAKVNGMLLNGKIVFVGEFVPKKDRKPVNADKVFTNVFVKNLDEEVTEEQFKAMFEKFGKVTSMKLMCDAEGKSKCFGFVNYEDHEAASKAVEELNGTKSGEKTLYVGRAEKKSEREAHLRAEFERRKNERLTKWQGVNLYVKNLDDTVDEEALREAFKEFGTITSVKIMMDEKNHTRGFGFVCFSTPEEANKACTEMNGRMVANKPIYVAQAQRKEVRKAQLEAQHAARANLRMQPGQAAMGGMAPPMGYPGAPPAVFYGQAGMPPQAQRGFVYPQQMPGMRRWQPNQPGARAPAGYQLPGYVMPVGQQQRPQRGGARGGQQQRGGAPVAGVPVAGQQGQAGRGGANGRRNFKYTTGATNMPTMAVPVPAMAIPGAEQPEGLSPQRLAAATAEERRQILGDHLFPLVAQEQPVDAAKITGMILEVTEPGEVMSLLEDPSALKEKIEEAVAIIEEEDADAEKEGSAEPAAAAAAE